jgi:hypothetical protein
MSRESLGLVETRRRRRMRLRRDRRALAEARLRLAERLRPEVARAARTVRVALARRVGRRLVPAAATKF